MAVAGAAHHSPLAWGVAVHGRAMQGCPVAALGAASARRWGGGLIRAANHNASYAEPPEAHERPAPGWPLHGDGGLPTCLLGRYCPQKAITLCLFVASNMPAAPMSLCCAQAKVALPSQALCGSPLAPIRLRGAARRPTALLTNCLPSQLLPPPSAACRRRHRRGCHAAASGQEPQPQLEQQAEQGWWHSSASAMTAAVLLPLGGMLWPAAALAAADAAAYNPAGGEETLKTIAGVVSIS